MPFLHSLTGPSVEVSQAEYNAMEADWLRRIAVFKAEIPKDAQPGQWFQSSSQIEAKLTQEMISEAHSNA